MELLLLARDMMSRKQNPITYPCHILDVCVKSEDELNVELSKFFLFTYRTGFSPLPKSSCTSDKGWGCLARTCQMMLARTLAKFCPQDFQLIHFRDEDKPDAPFSLHNLVRGMSSQTNNFQPNYWSPSQGCEALRHAVAAAVNRKFIKTAMSVLVAESGTIRNEDVVFRLSEMGAVLLLIPVRVGIKRHINQPTFMALEKMIQSPYSVGVVGGVPNRSYYIIGTCGQRVLYLDPHVEVRPALLNPSAQGGFTESAETLPAVLWDRIDTSLLFGFFLKTVEDWMTLTEYIKYNTGSCGLERLFCIDSADSSTARRGSTERRPEDHVLTWESSDEDQ